MTEPTGEIEQPALAQLFADLSLLMAKDKSVVPDTKGHFGKYPSHNVCVQKVAELIRGTGLAYYQSTQVEEGFVSVETVISHEAGAQLPTGTIRIPYASKGAKEIAVALGWAKRLSLVSAFSLGTAELEDEPPKPFAGINVPNPAMSGGGMRAMETMPDDLPLPTVEERINQIRRINNIAMLESYYKSLPMEMRGTLAIVEEVRKRKEQLSPEGKA